MFPRLVDNAGADQPNETGLPDYPGPDTQIVPNPASRWVIANFDIATVVQMARRANAVVAIECGVGETTLLEDTVLLRVHGVAQKVPEPVLTRAIRLATARTFEQDPKYAIRLLVDIAIRALSPPSLSNDGGAGGLDQSPGSVAEELGRRQLDAGFAKRMQGITIRVTFPVPTWQDYLALSFDEIRQFGTDFGPKSWRRLRSALVGLADTVAGQQCRDEVLRHLDHLNRGLAAQASMTRIRRRALLQDRQGLGLSREQNKTTEAPAVPRKPAQQSALP